MKKILIFLLFIFIVIFIQLQFIVGMAVKPKGLVYLGTVHYPPDYFYYLSQFVQGKTNWLTSTMLFTHEKLNPVYIGWQHVLSGRIFTSLGLNVIYSYQAAVITFLSFYLFVSYLLIKIIYPRNISRRLMAFFFFTTSTSFLWIEKTAGTWKVGFYSYWYNLGNIIARFGPTPHHLIAYGLGVLYLIFLIRWFNSGKRNPLLFLILSVVSFLQASINPVSWGLNILTSFAVSIFLGMRKPLLSRNKIAVYLKNNFLFLFTPFIICLFAGFLPAVYARKVFSTAPYSYSQIWESMQFIDVTFPILFLGSGVVVIFALIGIFPYIRRINNSRIIILIFFMISLYFYMGIIPRYLHVTNVRFYPSQIYIVWSILACEGVFLLSGLFRKFKSAVLAVLIIIYVVTVGPSYYLQYKEIFKPKIWNAFYYIPDDIYKAYIESEKLSKPLDVFLVNWPHNESFAALTGRKSYFGFGMLTIDSEEKNRNAYSILDMKFSEDEAKKIMYLANIKYVLTYSTNKMSDKYRFLKKIYSNPGMTLYRAEI